MKRVQAHYPTPAVQQPSSPAAPPLHRAVEGRTHGVQVHYLEQATNNYLQAAVEAVVGIHKEDRPGDVLLFLTGQDECETGAPLAAAAACCCVLHAAAAADAL